MATISRRSRSGIPGTQGDAGTARATRTPPGRLYWDPGVLRDELDRFFYRNWLCIGREAEVAARGDFLTRTVGGESLLVVRDDAAQLKGFYNLCRHRGTRVALERHGRGVHSFICTYHAWSYGLDGRLIGAPHMNGAPEFDRNDYGLHPIRVDTWGGFVWVNLEPKAPDLRASLGPFFERFDRLPLADLRRGAEQQYEVEANWKIIVENFSECYHCAPVHPSLNRITPATRGRNDARFMDRSGRSRFAGGYMEFAKDFQSMTRSGYTDRPTIPGMTAEDRRRIYYYVLFPNTFFSLLPDYLMIHRVWPISPSHSSIENEFYFTRVARAMNAFDPRDAVDMWNEVNLQDWKVCELAQEGTGSRAWKGGRYSDSEELVQDFDRFVTGGWSEVGNRPRASEPRRHRPRSKAG
jgi:glycine betaine catabolism A